MARAVGMRIVGEGVETERQLEFLNREHCDCAQGFLLGRPMPAAELSGRSGGCCVSVTRV
jgi:EAL domain-containing protein (putative c-di-GMP-specific phosphodiesterase class I)